MGTKWTPQQRQVIDLRDRNILVSAAAGSGKTAVLVERIVAMLTDPKKPVDVDRLLIVTFTNAAAAQMRERIGAALEARLSLEPGNPHLQRQLTLIHSAQITTIHSFCMHVIKNYFHRIQLDPNFRMMEEGERKLLQSDVLDELLEDHFSGKDTSPWCEHPVGQEDFLAFVEWYSTGKSDGRIKDLLLQCYEFSMSYPDPKAWRSSCLAPYEAGSFARMEGASWMGQLISHLRQQLSDVKRQLGHGLAMSREPGGPYMYEAALLSDLETVELLEGAGSFTDLYRLSQNITFQRLSSKKDGQVSQEKKEAAKALRDQGKKAIQSLQEQFFSQSPEAFQEDMAKCGPVAKTLAALTDEFHRRFTEKKREHNMLDFNDLEHCALGILVDGQGNPTPTADELSHRYEEILIDEYQDSNDVQELLLRSVSRERFGRNNIFMVGDVKQSIYSFRQARPRLFMEKSDTYSREDGPCQRIDLHKNFRSRARVLEDINSIFYKIMGKTLGNIDYNQECALNAGREDFPESGRKEDTCTEVIPVDYEKAFCKEQGISRQELEAEAVALRIARMVSGEAAIQVTDKKSGTLRPACYSDIVILLRSVAGWGETYANVLMRHGIPAYVTSKTGYFSAWEVGVTLSLIAIVDNPRQDIPLAAVLGSPMVGLTAEELAILRCQGPGEGNARPPLPRSPKGQEDLHRQRLKGSLYDAMTQFQPADGAQKEQQLFGKLKHFRENLEDFRKRAAYMPISALIDHMLEVTGFRLFLTAMPGGRQRRANVDMLVEKALEYEKTSYSGLFHFVRYMDQLQKYQVDFGEAGILNENENIVRIMSIHKSKGLEFPIVIVGGLGKNFNTSDAREPVVLHPDMGMGMDFIDPTLRVRTPTLIKRALARQIRLDTLGEELRILYVAMTRAMEKLILVGTVENLPEKEEKWQLAMEYADGKLMTRDLAGASSYLDWIMMALYAGGGQAMGSMAVTALDCETLLQARASEGAKREQDRALLCRQAEAASSEPGIRQEIHRRLTYRYPFRRELDFKSKYTVTELKRIMQQEEDGAARLYEEPVVVPLIPDFARQEQKKVGAYRGTAYHRVLEHLDFGRAAKGDDIRKMIGEMVQAGTLPQDMADMIDFRKMEIFARSPLARRMANAREAGKLYLEQPFVMLCAPREEPALAALGGADGAGSDEEILVQGIIDAYFEEEGELVLVDYKTDSVKSKEALLDQYRPQLELYARALQRFSPLPLKEKLIYSFALQEEVVV